MLVFSRKRGEEFLIGNGIRVTVLEIRGNQVKLGFVAPAEAKICRQEIQQAVKRLRPTQALAHPHVATASLDLFFLPRFGKGHKAFAAPTALEIASPRSRL